MSKQQYLRALNKEIQKLNGIIDHKIMHHDDYRRESRRHKELLQQIRREEHRQPLLRVLGTTFFRHV